MGTHVSAAKFLCLDRRQQRCRRHGGRGAGLLLTAKSSVGLAVLPVHVGLQTDLVRVIESTAELNSRIYLLMHPDLRNTPRVRAFFDFVVAEIDSFRPLLRGELPAQV